MQSSKQHAMTPYVIYVNFSDTPNNFLGTMSAKNRHGLSLPLHILKKVGWVAGGVEG